mmetsp:Transcript_556/g.1661  ORF Transcript_556/g.1661 Transcript_556/m.1661 type:complete len:236 (+) Transcript_556:882-1589(+)
MAKRPQIFQCLAVDRRRFLVPSFDPIVVQGTLTAIPFVRIQDQQGLDEVLRRRRQFLETRRPIRLSSPDLSQHLIIAATERRAAREKHVRDDTKRPHVGLLSVGMRQYFWSHIMHRTASLRHLRAVIPELCEAEVNELQMVHVFSVLGLVQKVFELQIPMSYLVGMQISHRQEHLVCSLRRIFLGVLFPLREPVVQLSACHELHDQVDILIRFIHSLQPSNMRVVEREINFDLAL